MQPPDWAYDQTAIVFKYWQGTYEQIFVIEGLDHHFHLLPFFKSSYYCLITLPCHTTEWNFKYCGQCLDAQNPDLSRDRFIFLCNTKEQVRHARAHGFGALYFNQNALLDETVYSIRPLHVRPFNLVLNTRPEKEFKRPHLASSVHSLAIIEGYNFRKHDYFDLNTLNPSYINKRRLSTGEVVGIYNMSNCGGIFSEKEGACYSSSEYLLCGLPVLSTPSEGGRDVWYNKYNSVICEPNEESVKEGLDIALNHIATGFFNRERIRAMHLYLQHRMRDSLCSLVAKIANMSTSESYKLLKMNLARSNKLQDKMQINEAQRCLQDR